MYLLRHLCAAIIQKRALNFAIRGSPNYHIKIWVIEEMTIGVTAGGAFSATFKDR